LGPNIARRDRERELALRRDRPVDGISVRAVADSNPNLRDRCGTRESHEVEDAQLTGAGISPKPCPRKSGKERRENVTTEKQRRERKSCVTGDVE
jgi:hypothetical protein